MDFSDKFREMKKAAEERIKFLSGKLNITQAAEAEPLTEEAPASGRTQVSEAPETQPAEEAVTQDPAPQIPQAAEEAPVRKAAGSEAGKETGMLAEELVEEINAQELNDELMLAHLRRYQQFGAKYIVNRKHALLGDEMGLGKTIQALAVMAHLAWSGKRRFLVVCPLSVMVNWVREIERHSQLEAVAIHGNDRGEEFTLWKEQCPVGVTSFETLERLPLNEVKALDLIVVDEAHNVKNAKAKRTQNVLLLVQRSERVLYMTGTPLENRVEEMRFLIESIDHALGTKLRLLPAVADETFRRTIAQVYLRRGREEVLGELPELIESEEWLEMTAAEKEAYKKSLRKQNFMAVRRISWDTGEQSSKLNRLCELVEEAVEDGRRVLVFSYFLDTLQMVADALGDLCIGRIDGSIPAAERQGLVDRFGACRKGAVLLGQVTAAGVGLNIQAASVVIFCEPQLKPSMEEQAIARAYRMGQERGVTVYRLLMKDSIDERIMQILKEKQEIFDRYADHSVVGDEDLQQNKQAYLKELMEEELRRLEGKNAAESGEGAEESQTGEENVAGGAEAQDGGPEQIPEEKEEAESTNGKPEEHERQAEEIDDTDAS
ncbi:MAG: DEAD/DEAH box helicase family protein [Lachnospiraceae bacterium]|nr:DEAD/DEAH box helicase family protein [Lachnospiraceae bacterium]